jgi:hypothetical protein
MVFMVINVILIEKLAGWIVAALSRLLAGCWLEQKDSTTPWQRL